MARRGIAEPSEQELPSGAHRDVILAVHQLYRAAGFPSFRDIADAVQDGEYPALMNHQLVAEFLKGRTLSTLPKVQSFAMCLAEWPTPPGDRREASAQITSLWQAAMAASLRQADSPDSAEGDCLRFLSLLVRVVSPGIGTAACVRVVGWPGE